MPARHSQRRATFNHCDTECDFFIQSPWAGTLFVGFGLEEGQRVRGTWNLNGFLGIQPAGGVSSDFIDMIVCPWQSNSCQDMAGWCQENIKVLGGWAWFIVARF